MALFQAKRGQRVLFLTPLSTAERSADLLNCKVEHKGNPENSLPRNSLAFKAQNSQPGLAAAAFTPGHLCISAQHFALSPLCPPTRRGSISPPTPLLLALGLPALQQGGLVREADSGLFQRDCPMEWPTLWGAPLAPPLPQRL